MRPVLERRAAIRGGRMTLLWDVDTQVDFLIPGGRLYVPGAESILDNLARLTACAHDKHLTLISSACAHMPGDAELETYGPHCLAGTPGQQKVPETLLPNRHIVSNRRVDVPQLAAFQQVIIEKQEFDVFSNPNADELLRQLGPGLRVVLYGVVTEICVAAAARKLLERGHRVSLVEDAVRELDTAKAEAFTEEFLERGGEVITTDEAVGPKYAIAA